MGSHGSNVDLLIVGAGPAGLMAACCAAQYSISTRIIDKKETRTQTGHGDGFQTRTLEILDSFGLAQDILKQSTPESESSYWMAEKKPGNIQRVKTEKPDCGQDSRFAKALLNQGATEQVLLDYLEQKQDVHVERSKQAETLDIKDSSANISFPVSVGTWRLTADGSDGSSEREVINARYVLACDGAHSWTRDQLGISTEGDSKGSTWGIFDIVPITDFPDIRRSCAIHSEDMGSIMTVPRENRLVRFYALLQDSAEEKTVDASDDVPHTLVDIATMAMKPYYLHHKHCDWWSLYTVRRRLARKYRPHDRVFLVGDAAHSHSPLGGQGMNVSIQDSYNLVWKIGAVVTGLFQPTILDTYESERRPVAEELMRLDSSLVQAYEQGANARDRGVAEVCAEYSGFMSGISVSYPPSILINQGGRSENASARNVKLGMRMESVPVITHIDGTKTQLSRSLVTSGSWRLLVFPGDLRCQARMDILTQFVESFNKHPSLAILSKEFSKKTRGFALEPVLIHSSPTTAFDLLALPDIFHPFDEVLGWDYWKVFADKKPSPAELGPAYRSYGIDEEGPCCLILCRPDQHVAWVGDPEDLDFLDRHFSDLLWS